MKTTVMMLVMLLLMRGAVTEEQLSQPKEERAAQNSLPMSHDTLWGTLLQSKISYSSKEPHITAKLTPAIQVMAGKTVSLSGFVLPMDEAEKTSHFLLSKRTPTCPFCPPGEPNEVVEVFSKKPIKWDANLLTMRGTFALTNNTENGIFFLLKDAVPVNQAENFTMPLFNAGKQLY